MKPRLLLLQARRADDPMIAHERECFARTAGLPHDNVVPHDLTAGPPTLARLRQHDALTVGGSGDFYVSKGDLPNFEPLQDFLREVVALGHPTFASCFGYQCIVQALGGEIVHDPESTEVGTYELALTPEGRDDPLLGTLPKVFMAQLGHKDRADGHPDGVPNLAASPLSPFQALRVPGQPIWATQFHPELERETNLDRFKHYIQAYGTYIEMQELKAETDRFQESIETSSLLRRFFELVFP